MVANDAISSRKQLTEGVRNIEPLPEIIHESISSRLRNAIADIDRYTAELKPKIR